MTSPGTAPGDGMLPADPVAQPGNQSAPDLDPLQIVLEHTEGPRTDPGPRETEPQQTAPPEAEPPQAEPHQAEPAKAEPAKAGPPKAEPPQTGPRRTGSPETGPGDAEAPVIGTPSGQSADSADDTVVMAAIIDPAASPGRDLAPLSRAPDTARAAKLPSWPHVLATTIRLWAQRRLRRRSPSARGRRRWIIAVVLVVILLGAGAVTVALARKTPTGSGQAGNGALGTAATVRRQAATWVAQQVAADAIVACDPAMCSVLQGQGIPASRLLVLQSGNADPLGSDVVMATSAVRSQFGGRLVSVYAPEVLASFGRGSAQIAIRAVAPDGAAAYRAALRADLQARTAVGLQLLRNPRLHASASARRQLAAGEVDSRLLTTLATLTALYPIDVAGFGGSGAQASAGIPLRSADISGADISGADTSGAGSGATGAASLSSLKGFLLAQRAPYLPAEMDTVRLASGQLFLLIEFTAPSPLGLLGADG